MTSSPPPSSLQRAVSLDKVRDVMLLEGEEQMRVEPIPEQEGPTAPRAQLAARLRKTRVDEDLDSERVLSLELARIHFDSAFDVDMAVQLLHRALEIKDDDNLRAQLARQLAAMGRHVEAGHVLRDGEPDDAEEVFNAWLESGEAYARGGDAEEAVSTFRETAMIAPDHPLPFARIAAIAYWAPDVVPPERAADAWLEAGKRYPPGSEEHFRCVIRAFEVAPSYARSAEGYTKVLTRTSREGEADDVWRIYGIASGHGLAVAAKRAETALARNDPATALSAALEASITGRTSRRDDTLGQLLKDEQMRTWLRASAASSDIDKLSAALLEAARTKNNALRGEACQKLAEEMSGSARALLMGFAADAFAVSGKVEQACALAIQAARIAPWHTRAQAQLLALGGDQAIDLGMLEHALGHMPARTALHRLMAERYDHAGSPHMALAYTQQIIELRPGDLAPLEALLTRAADTKDAAIMANAIALVLGSPRPWRDLATPLGRCLRAMATVDPGRAVESAGQVLATIGPGRGELYEALRAIAGDAEDGVLELATTLGHAIGDEIEDDERGAVYIEAAELSLAYGDVEAAAVHVSRAAAHSADATRIAQLIEQLESAIAVLPAPARSDARLTLARARAWAAERSDARTAVAAWRQLGAMRWDLGDDDIGADEAFFVACAIEPDQGPYRYARDLASRAGSADAFPMIVERAVNVEHEGADAKLVAKLYAAAARVAADANLRELAIDAAVAAVRADPSRADAVAIVEKLAHNPDGLTALEFVYNALADAALGRFGFRAAHYRGARQLEKLNDYDGALRHAILAFEAVPSVGASYQMLLRVAERAGDEGAAVNTLAAVASTFPVDGQIAWLARAAELARSSKVGKDLRLELLLKALSLRPSGELVDALSDAARDALQQNGETHETALIGERLERAVRAALGKLAGPRAADVAVRLGVMASSVLARASLANAALIRAVDLDRHEGDYSAVLAGVDLIASDPVGAHQLLARINELRADATRPLSASLKDLTSKLYLALNEVPPSPPTPAVVPQAFSLSDADVEPAPQTPRMQQDEVPPTPITREMEPASDQMVTQIPPPREDARDAARLDAHFAEGAVDEDEQRFDDNFAALESDPGTHSDPGGIVKVTLSDNRPQAAPNPALMNTWQSHGAPTPSQSSDDITIPIVEAPFELTRKASDRPREGPAPLDDSILEDEAFNRQLAGEEDTRDTQRRVEDLRDIDFSPRSEAEARQRGDHLAIERMLAARARSTDNVEQRRLIRLRRAAVLEQRLDRLDDACAELELILTESGEDPTALRYLADLCDRRGRHARAAKLWLRASQQATDIDERIRDVVRCCESLVAADRPETAKKLIDAARGLPQSPKLLRLRIAVARKLDDRQELADATAQLRALGPSEDTPSSPPSESLRALDSKAPSEPPPPESAASLERSRRDTDSLGTRLAKESHRPSSSPARSATIDPAASSRRVYRVSALPGDDDSDRSAREVLQACHRTYLDRGPGGPRDAKNMIRRLRSIMDQLDDEDRDLHTFLLVESLDAAQGTGAAMLALQQHWETRGGTPLVTLAVADRLVRRGDVRPALQLYLRVMDRDLMGLRGRGRIALAASQLARRIGDEDRARGLLDIAARDEETREEATQRLGELAAMSKSTPPRDAGATEPFDLRWNAADALREPSRIPTDAPGASTPPPLDSAPSTPEDSMALPSDPGLPEPLTADPAAAVQRAAIEEPPSREIIDIGDEAESVYPVSSKPPPSSKPPISQSTIPPRIPSVPEMATAKEEEVFAELIHGSFEAGEALIAMYGEGRSHDALTVRRYQATLRRGDRQALLNLRQAAIADSAGAFARAVEHVVYAFDSQADPLGPPPLTDLPAQPEATRKLLFGWLDGTVNESLAIVSDCGMIRRDLTDYDLSGADRVPPVGNNPVGRVYAALSRLLDLGNRLFHVSRTEGPMTSTVALVSPLAAILSGIVHDTPALAYTLGGALACATPALALVEGLERSDLRNIVGALVAGFGPVADASLYEATPEQMRLAEDLWHMVPAASDRRLRAICEKPLTITVDAAMINAKATRRRTGLFACGDLVTAVTQTARELDLPVPERTPGGEGLRELCAVPAIADLYDLAILPEYAEARWHL